MGKQIGGLLYGSGKVGSRGQVVIPVEFRNFYKVKPRDTVIFMGNSQQNAFAIMKAECLVEMQEQMDSVRQQFARTKPEIR